MRTMHSKFQESNGGIKLSDFIDYLEKQDGVYKAQFVEVE